MDLQKLMSFKKNTSEILSPGGYRLFSVHLKLGDFFWYADRVRILVIMWKTWRQQWKQRG